MISHIILLPKNRVINNQVNDRTVAIIVFIPHVAAVAAAVASCVDITLVHSNIFTEYYKIKY